MKWHIYVKMRSDLGLERFQAQPKWEMSAYWNRRLTDELLTVITPRGRGCLRESQWAIYPPARFNRGLPCKCRSSAQ